MGMDSFFSKTNPFMVGLLRSRLHWPMSSFVMLLTVTGRMSGRRYTFPVGYQRDGGDVVVLVSEAPKKKWWRNFRTPGPVELHLRGRSCRGEAHLVPPGSEEFEERIEYTIRRVPGLAGSLGIDYDRKRGLTREQRKILAEQAVVVYVESIEPVHS